MKKRVLKEFPHVHLLGLVHLGGLQVGLFAPGSLTPPGQTPSLHLGLLGCHPQLRDISAGPLTTSDLPRADHRNMSTRTPPLQVDPETVLPGLRWFAIVVWRETVLLGDQIQGQHAVGGSGRLGRVIEDNMILLKKMFIQRYLIRRETQIETMRKMMCGTTAMRCPLVGSRRPWGIFALSLVGWTNTLSSSMVTWTEIEKLTPVHLKCPDEF